MSTLLQSLTRQQDLIPLAALSNKVEIIGTGAVGSVVSLTLAKMGLLNQEVWDFDEVDIVNMSSQGFAWKHIGMPKVDALADMFSLYSPDVSLTTNNAKFEGKEFLTGIVISALDSMEGRATIYKRAKSCGCKWLIDPRMSIQYGMIYVVDLSNREACQEYEKTLYSDEDAVQERCTMKAVMFTTNIIAGVVCKAVKDIITDTKPFKTMLYDIESNDCMFF